MTEEAGIREAIDHYSDGMKNARVESLKKAFHDLAILCGYIDDQMIAAPIQGLYDWVEANGVPDGYTCTVLGIEVTGRVATAKVRETDMHGDVIDHFHLLKDGERWWVVSKIWDSER
ncbi:MAG TPA: nuclear transport factor 2 family protein [Pyrinomonadaceae bacterium]|nr:nuclear transport factor 2 family protein [Pyrinomonadaceae bacterium]